MTLARLIRSARAQNARTVRVWINSNLGMVPAGLWSVTSRTLMADTGPGSAPISFGQFAKQAKHHGNFQDLTFRVKAHRDDLVCLATASTRPLRALYVPDAADNRHAGRHRQAKVTWSPLCMV